MRHAAIICEGFQDRAFISQWLEGLGLGRAPTGSVLRTKKGGTYEKADAAGRHVAIVPSMGLQNVVTDAALIIKNDSDSLERVLLIVDTDDKDPTAAKTAIQQSLAAASRTSHPAAADSSQIIENVEVRVEAWHPRLESIIEDALRAAAPVRLAHAEAFVANRPAPLPSTGKELAFSYCAAWVPDSFGEDFFAHVWRDPSIRPHLEARLGSAIASVQWVLGRA